MQVHSSNSIGIYKNIKINYLWLIHLRTAEPFLLVILVVFFFNSLDLNFTKKKIGKIVKLGKN